MGGRTHGSNCRLDLKLSYLDKETIPRKRSTDELASHSHPSEKVKQMGEEGHCTFPGNSIFYCEIATCTPLRHPYLETKQSPGFSPWSFFTSFSLHYVQKFTSKAHQDIWLLFPTLNQKDRAPQVYWHGDLTLCRCNGRLGTKRKGDSPTRYKNLKKIVIT
jgi:hypothetical protein